MNPAPLSLRWSLATLLSLLCALAQAASLSGTASYRERIALPPGAVFEASLERSARTDAPAQLLGRARLEPAGSPPFHFMINYDASALAPHAPLKLRAIVRHAGRLLFAGEASIDAVEVGKRERIDLLMLARTDNTGDDAAAALGGLPASFEGLLPCADCSGVRWHLDLEPDNSYRLRRSYEGRPQPLVDDSIGTWALIGKPTILRLSGGADDAPAFALETPAALKLLDRDARPITSSHSYKLTRLATTALIEPRLPLTGIYRPEANSEVIQLCATGNTLPVLAEGDHAALQRAYAQARATPGAALKVSFIGQLVNRSGEAGMHTQIRVERFQRVLNGKFCQPEAANAPLQGSRWHLVRLGEMRIESRNTDESPHLLLRAAGKVGGFAGCNRFSGRYLQAGEALNFDRLTATRRSCSQGTELEAAFLSALRQTTRWQIDGQRLSLLDASGTRVAQFEAEALR